MTTRTDDVAAVHTELPTADGEVRERAERWSAHELELRRTWDRIRTMVYNDDRREQVCAELGMSFIKAKALRRLLGGPLHMRGLTAALQTDKPYVSQVVDWLAERGLVVRAVDEHDRRCRIISLTGEGRAKAELADEILNRPPTGLSALPAADLAELTRILTAVEQGAGTDLG